MPPVFRNERRDRSFVITISKVKVYNHGRYGFFFWPVCLSVVIFVGIAKIRKEVSRFRIFSCRVFTENVFSETIISNPLSLCRLLERVEESCGSLIFAERRES